MVAVRSAVLTQADGARWTLSNGRTPGAEGWIVENVTGWHGGSGVRSWSESRLRHGNFTARAWRENRKITLQGIVVAPDSDTRDWHERSLSGMAGDGDWCDLTCDAGRHVLSTRVRLDGEPQIVRIGTQALRFQLPLEADSPFLVSAWRETTLQPAGAGVGLEYTTFTRGGIITFGSEIEHDERIWNDGNTESQPVFEVWADSPSGFRVGLDGHVVEWSGLCLPDVPVLVDMTGSVTVGGHDQSSQLVRRDWASIPAQSISSPTFELLQGGRGFARVRHRDTYI